MIEDALLKYFRGDASLVAALGGATKIDINEVADGTKTPWLAIEVSPGTRNKVSQALMEQRSTIRVTVTGGPQQKVAAKTIADMALRLLENYRGGLYSIQDAHITCSAVNSLPGLSGSNRYRFVASIRFTEAITTPNVV